MDRQEVRIRRVSVEIQTAVIAKKASALQRMSAL